MFTSCPVFESIFGEIPSNDTNFCVSRTLVNAAYRPRQEGKSTCTWSHWQLGTVSIYSEIYHLRISQILVCVLKIGHLIGVSAKLLPTGLSNLKGLRWFYTSSLVTSRINEILLQDDVSGIEMGPYFRCSCEMGRPSDGQLWLNHSTFHPRWGWHRNITTYVRHVSEKIENIYLHFLSYFDVVMSRVVEELPHEMQRPVWSA